jgi:hypothetical protein
MLVVCARTTKGTTSFAIGCATMRSRFCCCTGANAVQQSELQGEVTEVVFFVLSPV